VDHQGRLEFPGLPEACLISGTETAQRFLASAYDSVEDLFDWHQSANDLAEEDHKIDPELGSRTRESAQDMLRSMIVFAGAGIDAVLKQLIRESLEPLVSKSELASQKLSEFVEARLDPAARGSVKRLTRYLLSPSPRQALIEDYVLDLTGSSLQSVAQLDRALSGLGVLDRNLRRRCKELQPLFEARNEIVHELDLLELDTPGDRHRRTRTMTQSVDLAHLGLEIGQLIINAVGALLESNAELEGPEPEPKQG